MKGQIHQILISILLSVFICAAPAYARSYGESCTVLPLNDAANYLRSSTVYGYIQQNIDMKGEDIDGCKPGGNQLKFCIRNGDVCTKVNMRVGKTSKLKDLADDAYIKRTPSLANVELSARVIKNKVCLVMPTSRGSMPLICRNAEPSSGNPPPDDRDRCQTLGKSCYDKSNKSQSLLSFSGLTIHCLRDTLHKVFYVGNDCPIPDDDNVSLLKPFPDFQKAMKRIVSMALLLYTMFYGINLVMSHEYIQLNKAALFVIKLVLVLYFSIGIGSYQDGIGGSPNGVTEFVLPLLTELSTKFTEMIFLAGGSQGLCDFDVSKYEKGYEFYKLWDAIDCRIGYYLGMQALYNVGSIINGINGGAADMASSSGEGVLLFFHALMGFFLSGNIIIVLLGLIFVVVLMSVLLYFITAYLVCLVTLYAMAYISPIFVPMALFERTQIYFDAWVKVTVSAALQPAVIGGFLALLLTMYDSSIYGNCEFKRHDYNIESIKFSTFEIRPPAHDAKECTDSFGYKMTRYYSGHGWEKKTAILFSFNRLKDPLDATTSLIYVMIFVFIFYFFMGSVSAFVSDLTGGASVDLVTASPTALMDKAGGAAASYAAAARARMQKSMGNKDSGNNNASRGNSANDSVSTGGGGGGASDSVSTGNNEENN